MRDTFLLRSSARCAARKDAFTVALRWKRLVLSDVEERPDAVTLKPSLVL
jgi:hypothetical protein